MHQHLTTIIGLVLGLASAEGVSVTPHQQYSSSIGVPGCLIDTNRVAYFPRMPSCTEPCVRVTHPKSNRKLTLLQIDQSQGAYDISYDAWNTLISGQGAKENPQTGGGVDMEIESVAFDDGECQALLEKTGGKIPIIAISPNWPIEMCKDNPDNVVLHNFDMQSCKTGSDEVCDMDENYGISCPSGLGLGEGYDGPTVVDIAFGTGEEVPAP